MARRGADDKQAMPGLAIDASGGPVVDPTANVLALSQASNRRQDDLRMETNRRLDTELTCVKEVAALRAEHAEKMALAESKRLDAVRAVDVLNVSAAAERADAAIKILATTTAANADNLRTAMSTTAAAVAEANGRTFAAITDRIAALEKSSYEGKGKSTITDPALTELIAEMKRVTEAQSGSAGKSAGLSMGWGLLIGAVPTIVALYALLKPAAVLVR